MIIRSFIAVPLPVKTRNFLAKIQEQLKQKVSKKRFKWVEKKNFHQTLIFLGNVDEKRIPEIKNFMKQLSKNRPLELSLARVSFFPDQRRIKIAWVSLSGQTARLSRLCHKLRMSLQLAGFSFDTRFSPHITLGRTRSLSAKLIFSKKCLSGIYDFLHENDTSFIANKVVFYKSELTPRGPVYTPIFQVKLTS